MKINRKILLLAILTIGILLGLSTEAFASSISVSTSKNTVSAGESFNVTISGNDAIGKINVNVSNGSGSTSVWIENNSETIAVTAGKSGTVTISASGEVSDSNGVDHNVSDSKSVTIKEQPTPTQPPENKPTPTQKPTPTPVVKSSNANLKNLVVSPVDFKGFRSSITSGYSVTVENNVTEVQIKATKSDEKATVEVLGNKNLKEGANKVEVIVTAEDGTKKTYTVIVNRKKAGETTTTPTPTPDTTPVTAEPVDDDNNSDETEVDKDPVLGITSIKLTGLTKTDVTIEPNITPEFNQNIYEYKTTVPVDVDNIKIEAKVNVEGATVEVMGNKDLVVGENIITILVKLPNEEEKQSYQIIVTKTKDSINQENDNLVKILIIGAAIAIVVIAIIIAVVNYIRRKKEDEEYEEPTIRSIYMADEILGKDEEGQDNNTDEFSRKNNSDRKKNGKRFK